MILEMSPMLRGETNRIDFEYSLTPEPVDRITFEGDARVEGYVTDNAGYMRLCATAKLAYIADCDRCLEKVNGEYVLEFERTVADEGTLTDEQLEDNIDEYVVFEDGKLGTCIYYTTHTQADTNDYITDYKTTIERYKNKYGAPLYEEQKWSDGAKTSDPSKFAEGLEKGIMMYRTGWEIGNTKINIVLFKDTDAKIKIGIRYQAKDINAEGDVAPIGDIEI